MGWVRENTGIDLTGDDSLLGKTLDATGNLIEKVGDTVEAIVSDPKKLAMVGLAVAFPGAAATIGTNLGLSGAAASVVGQTLINTAINGGDVEQAVKSAAVMYVGAEAAGEIGKLAKDSGASDAIAKTVGQSAGQAVTAAAMGKDPLLALVAGGANVAAGLITQEIPGFSALPEAAQNAMRNAIAADMQGQDAIGAAASTLVNNAMGYAKNYAKVQTDLAAKGLAALDANALAAIKDADVTDITNVVKAAETAQTYGRTLDADDISSIAGLQDSSKVDTYVTDNIVNPALAERAGFGTDVNAWEEAQALGFTTAKDFNQYETFADMYKDVFGKEGTPDEVKQYLPHQVKLQDTLDALKIHLGKKEATASDIDRLDFDRDGAVDLDDVLNLQKYYLGKNTTVDPSDYWTKNATPEAALENMRAAYAAGLTDTGSDQVTQDDLVNIVTSQDSVMGGEATTQGGAGTDTTIGGQDSVMGGEAATQGGAGTDTTIGGQDAGTTLTGDDGSTLTINPDGSVSSTDATDLNQSILTGGSGATDTITGGTTTQPNIEYHADGSYTVTYEDGTSAVFNADGTPYSTKDDTGTNTISVFADDTSPSGFRDSLGNPVNADGTPYVAQTTGTDTLTGGSSTVTGGGSGGQPAVPPPTNPVITPGTPSAPAAPSRSGLDLGALLGLLGATQAQQAPTPPPTVDIGEQLDLEEALQTNPFAKKQTQSKMAEGGSIDDLLALLQQRG